MWIKREIEEILAQVSVERPALILTGCRQAGKTSLLRRSFPDTRYVTLDIPLEAAQADEAGEEFLKKNPPPLIVDEVQYAPNLLRHLKVAIDRDREATGRFLLTGSQRFQLMEKVTESLAGRCAILECHSLAAIEYERWSQKTLEGDALWEWIWKGGYPELHAKEISPDRFYSDYLVTYLERDVRQIVQVRNLRDFDRFLRLCAVRTAQLLSYNSLASDIGVSPHTIKSWLSVLESSNVIYLLEPYYRNLGKRIVKTPKLYFLDTGLASFLAGFRSWQELQTSPLAGAFFETHVLGQIVRFFGNRGRRAGLFFYRDHYGHEVDFVIPVGNAFKLMECKLTDLPPSRMAGFQELIQLVGRERILSQSVITSRRGQTSWGGASSISDSIDLEKILGS